jgi:hypothetical protein
VRVPLLAGAVRVEAVVRPYSSASASGVEPIARIADSARDEILLLGRRRDELLFRLRLRASTIRLETPGFSLAQAFDGSTTYDVGNRGSVDTVSAILERGRLRLSAQQEKKFVSRKFELGPALAWSFFLPWDYWFGAKAGLISQVWIAVLLLPVGYWAALTRSGNGAKWTMAAILTVVPATLTMIPAIFEVPPTSVLEDVSCAVGLATGWIIGILFARHVPRRKAE